MPIYKLRLKLMSKLQPVKWKDFVRKLKKLGFEGPFTGGRHPYMIKGDIVLTIPNPHKQEIGVDLLVRILQQAQLSRNDWQNA